MIQSLSLGAMIQNFFTDKLARQMNASPNTIASYRDTWRLYLMFLCNKSNRSIDKIEIANVNADSIVLFLDHLEQDRNCSIRSRNQRLAAFKSFFKHAVFLEPSIMQQSERVMCIPSKIYHKQILGYLTKAEVKAIFDSIDRTTKSGRRSYALFQFMYNTGARASEVLSVSTQSFVLKKGAATVLINGKGSKQRVVPIWDETASLIKDLITETSAGRSDFIFCNRNSETLTRSGLRYLLLSLVERASSSMHSLKTKHISPHTLRHTTAMHLLQSGIDINLIRMWLGHVKLDTTHQYIEADVDMKRQALIKGGIVQPNTNPKWKPSEQILEFLNSLSK